MTNKHLLDDLKSSMDVALTTRTKIFLDYALDDVVILKQIKESFVRLVNDVLRKTLGLPWYLSFTGKDIPKTMGRLVAESFERFIIHSSSADYKSVLSCYAGLEGVKPLLNDEKKWVTPFLAAVWSLSGVKLNLKDRHKVLAMYKDIFSSGSCLDVLEKLMKYEEKTKNWHFKSPLELGPYSSASIGAIALGDKKSSAILNALVCGGRANNEQPWNYKATNVLDIDLQSCYGTALPTLTYPIGVPTVVAFGQNQERMTLKEFLKKHEHELLPDLYKIMVSGKLTFQQDLIYSKVTTLSKIKEGFTDLSRKHGEGDDDTSHVQADLVLSRCEILNGTITSDILETLRGVSTSRELGEIMNLNVETAMFWKKSDQCNSIDEWIHSVLENPGSLTFSDEYQTIVDTRSRKWVGLPLEDFVGKLVDKRVTFKQKAKSTKNEKLKREYNGYQHILKLFTNTVYGCFASPFFTIGNTVLADVITARARVEVWKIAKSLNLYQCITDGGLYSPTQVNSFKQVNNLKKPGLSVLSDVRSLQNHRSIKTVQLGRKDWNSIFKDDNLLEHLKTVDGLTLEHTNKFWSVYDLPLKLKVEHKVENTAAKSIYLGKANYGLLTFNSKTKKFDKPLLKVRGTNES
jgi:hypothetical protein